MGLAMSSLIENAMIALVKECKCPVCGYITESAKDDNRSASEMVHYTGCSLGRYMRVLNTSSHRLLRGSEAVGYAVDLKNAMDALLLDL